MLQTKDISAMTVVGPDGETLSFDALPPPNPGRWVSRRKAQVIAAIAGGLLTIEEACARYALTVEELTRWQRLFDHSGVAGLRATRTKEYRALVRDL